MTMRYRPWLSVPALASVMPRARRSNARLRSNCRWYWGTAEGTAEPTVPWCGLMWPDATPVSLAEAEAELQMVAFLNEYVPKQVSPMCGNSICQDRRFLARWMPALEGYFHYRNLDVSTLKELAKRWRPELSKGLTKHGKHEALADIYESIEELKYYREHFLKV